MWTVDAIFGGFTAQVDWGGLGIGGQSAFIK